MQRLERCVRKDVQVRILSGAQDPNEGKLMSDYTREEWDEIKALKPTPKVLWEFTGHNRARRRANGQYTGFSRKAVRASVRPSGRALTHGQALALEKLSALN